MKLTMKAAASAISGPQVSVMISRVRALDPTSIPLLTNMISGMFSMLNLGRRVRKVSLWSCLERRRAHEVKPGVPQKLSRNSK